MSDVSIATSEPLRLFYSYSPEDEELRAELEKHLALLRRQKVISEWHHRLIMPGNLRSQEVDKNLKIADIVLLLVSSDFLASDYCYEAEMQVAIGRHGDEARVIPIILRPCDWDRAPFRRHIVLPRYEKPVTSWSNRDEAWTDVAQGIRLICEQLLPLKRRREHAQASERARATSELALASWTDAVEGSQRTHERLLSPERSHEYEHARELALTRMKNQERHEPQSNRMAVSPNRGLWQEKGSRSVVRAERPDHFLNQHVLPLLLQRTEDASKSGDCRDTTTEEDFWRQEGGIFFGAVRLREFKLTDWFPRAPGVYWSRHAEGVRKSTFSRAPNVDPELGNYFSPLAKTGLVEHGGIGTIRLLRRKIDDELCWFATALVGTACHAGIPLAIPMTLLHKSGVEWGDQCNLRGRVRFLQEVGLNDTAASVHHARPLIVFVEELEGVASRHASEPVIITPVALFTVADWRVRAEYTFMHCNAGRDGELDDAADWIERYASKHDGHVITNFDEQRPILADAPLSYQRLIAKTYDRAVVRNIAGTVLEDRIDQAAQKSATTEHYSATTSSESGVNIPSAKQIRDRM